MPLPTAIHYEPPETRSFASRAGWSLSPSRAALLVHDLQQYFTRVYADACPAFTQALAATERLLVAARAAGVPVVYTAQPGNQERSSRGLLYDVWGPGLSATPQDTSILASVAPADGEPVLTKHRYSAFVRTDLEDWMRDRGRDQLIVTGVYGHIGVLATATDAFMRDLQPFVVGDAIADFNADLHTQALAVTASLGGKVTTAADVLATLNGEASWERWLADRLGSLLEDSAAGAALVADAKQDVFESGLDSLRSFSLLDDLADRGVDVDFADFVSAGTVAYLLEEIERSGVPAPAGL